MTKDKTTPKTTREPSALDTLIAEVRKTARAVRRANEKSADAAEALAAAQGAHKSACDAVAAYGQGGTVPGGDNA